MKNNNVDANSMLNIPTDRRNLNLTGLFQCKGIQSADSYLECIGECFQIINDIARTSKANNTDFLHGREMTRALTS